MCAYWRAACSHRGVSWQCAPVPGSTLAHLEPEQPLQSLILTAASLLVESPDATYVLGSIYSSMLPQETRSKDGVFYTPPTLVARLLNHITHHGFDWGRGRVLDPACGNGVFLVAVAQQMLAKREALPPDERLASIAIDLCGWELDPFAAWMAHICVEVAILDLAILANRRLSCIISVRDSLASDPLAQFSLIVGNPPYGKVSLPPCLRKRYARSVFGHANLYGLFTDLAVQVAIPGGLIAFVTPTSFLGGAYFKSLREVLVTNAPPVRIDFVEARGGVFDNVLQETVLAVFSKDSIAPDIEVYHCTDCSLPPGDELVARVPAPAGTNPWVLPRTGEQASLLVSIALMTGRLADYGLSVSTGPLVWNRHKTQLHSTAREGALPIVWAESLSIDGFKLKSDQRNHASHIDVLSGQEHLISRIPMILLQRTTSKEQSRRLVCGLLPQRTIDMHGGVVVENHVNIIRHRTSEELVSLEAVALLLSSRVVDSVFRCISGSVAVSAYELNTLPVPPVEDIRNLSALIATGASKECLDVFIAMLYGSAP
jgi:adenine-specific DNA-methyltransferase